MLTTTHLFRPGIRPSGGLLLLSVLFVTGCLDRAPVEPLNAIVPPIAISWPQSGASVMTGRREILYDFQSAKATEQYDLVVNDSLLASFPVGTDGVKPHIYWAVDTSLIGTNVRLLLRAHDADGNIATSTTVTGIRVVPPYLPPAAPRNLFLWRLSDTAVNLTWDDSSSDEAAFELWRGTDTGPLTRIQTLRPNSISTNDTGLVRGTLYRYRVRSVNPYGFGETNEVSFGSGAPVLIAPSNVTLIPRGTRRVEIQWTDNTTGELGYVIQRRVATGTIYSQIALVEPNTQSFIDTVGLSGGSAFTYRIAARGQFGQSDWSREETVTTLYTDVFPPTGLIGVFDIPSGSVKLTWKDNTVFEVQTRIERRTNPIGAYAEIGRTGVDIITYKDTTAVRGVTYSYRVRVYAVGDYLTEYSNEFTITVPTLSGSAVPAGTRRKEEVVR
jgi:hypothetical protein